MNVQENLNCYSDQKLNNFNQLNNLNENTWNSLSEKPYVRITEQPARCALRFRYVCEGRSAGSIPGCNSTSDKKTYPTIEIVNYKGPAVVIVSCVTRQPPYRPHPHNLVGKEGCKKGVCRLLISNSQMKYQFPSLGIQCVKKRDIVESLRTRESMKIDPFRTGFAHSSEISSIDLNVVRLCFQVFIKGSEKEKFNIPLTPIISEPIFDKKTMSELTIVKLSSVYATISSQQEIILLCDRINKDDIQIRFFEEHNGQIIWESYADFLPKNVHKQTAICFKIPKYRLDFINQPVKVFIQLRRPSDGHLSESHSFLYLPDSNYPAITSNFTNNLVSSASNQTNNFSQSISNNLTTNVSNNFVNSITTSFSNNLTNEIQVNKDNLINNLSSTIASNNNICYSQFSGNMNKKRCKTQNRDEDLSWRYCHVDYSNLSGYLDLY